MLTTDLSKICVPGYTKTVRHTSGRLKHEIYVEYHIDPRSGHYEIDHLIPLEVGGADVAANLWPESYDTRPWTAHVKDRLENCLHEQVCAGRMPLDEVQKEIAGDWIEAYRKYLGEAR
ncbi:MAG: HNH endonuclease [Alphaproteobacteria bacterium]|nr:HNH endonuclease [Alphaproteobacteria bacterium]